MLGCGFSESGEPLLNFQRPGNLDFYEILKIFKHCLKSKNIYIRAKSSPSACLQAVGQSLNRLLLTFPVRGDAAMSASLPLGLGFSHCSQGFVPGDSRGSVKNTGYKGLNPMLCSCVPSPPLL